MTTAQQKKPLDRFWSTLGSVCSLLAIAAFVSASLYAKWNPVQGGETQKAAKGAKGKIKRADPVKSSVLAPIGGTGRKLDVHDLANLIDGQVSKRLAAEGFKPSQRAEDAEFL